MSDYSLDRFELVPEEEAEEPQESGGYSLNRFEYNPPEDLDRSPMGQARRDPRYTELLYTLALGRIARENPEAGDVEVYVERTTRLLEELASAYDLAQTPLANRAMEDLPAFMDEANMPGLTSRVARVGANTLGTISSAFQPLQLPGDWLRTYIANLSEVQKQRDQRDLGFETTPIDSQTGVARGSPASNPITAFGEMFRAAELTNEQLELTPGTNFRGLYVYAPDFEFAGRRFFGVSPYEEDRAVRGTDLVRRFGLDARFGVTNDAGREWLGLGVEMILDPLNFADILFLGSRVMRTVANRSGDAAWMANATRLERSASGVYRALTPRGAIENVAGIVNDASRVVAGSGLGVVDVVVGALNSGINKFLDRPLGNAWQWIFPEKMRPQHTAGVYDLPEEALRPQWRDVFGQQGTFAWLPGPRPSWLTGGPDTGLSAGEVAMGYRNEIQKIGGRGIVEMGQAVTRGLPTRTMTLRMPWARLAVPGVRSIDPKYAGYVRGLNAAISDWLDTAAFNVSVKSDPKMMQRLQDISELYSLPMVDTLERFNSAVNAGRRVILQVGYETSGYRIFVEAMQRASNDLGVDYNDYRRAYENLIGGVDLQRLEVGDYFQFVKPGSTNAQLATPASQARADTIVNAYGTVDVYGNPTPAALQFEAWVNAVNGHLDAMGASHLRGITPEQFLEGSTGYLRRIFQGTQEPAKAAERLFTNEVIVLREVDALPTVDLLKAQFGNAVEDDVLKFLMARTPTVPRGRIPGSEGLAMHFRTEDLATIISRHTSQPVTASQVAEVIYRHDPNFEYLNETIGVLKSVHPSYGTGGVPYAQTPARFQAREDIDAEYLVKLLVETDPLARVASVAAVGGRQVMAQEFLGMAWANLNADGLVVPGAQLEALDLARTRAGNNPMPTTINGVRYVIMPDNPAVWGPFAGNAIPESIARTMVTTLARPNVSQSAWERLLGMWRQMLISPLPTSLRNVLGNFLLIQQAGGNLTDLLAAIPRAVALRREFIDTGRLPEEFRGYEHLFGFIRDESTMTGLATKSTEEMLLGIADGSTPIERVLGRSVDMGSPGEFVQWLTRGQTPQGTVARVALSAGGTGALGIFQAGEEISRLTGFLSTYDSLIAAGVAKEEAIARASHFAVNSAYNYAAMPGVVDVMRRSGVSAFPQFSYFTLGRTPRVMAENPMAITRFEYARRGINLAMTEGDTREQEQITQMIEGWQRYAMPLAFPVRDQDGRWRIADMQYQFPQGASPTEFFFDPFTFPAISPFLDSVWAWTGAFGPKGESVFSARYGGNVFDSYETIPRQIGQTAEFIAGRSLIPGIYRSWNNVVESAEYMSNRPRMDMWAAAQMRNLNMEPIQVIARIFGVNLRNVSTRMSDPRFNQELDAINRRYFGIGGEGMISRIDAEIETEIAENGGATERYQRLQERRNELEEQWFQELMHFMRVMGGN